MLTCLAIFAALLIVAAVVHLTDNVVARAIIVVVALLCTGAIARKSAPT
jgi:hypothetical protein